VVVDPRRSETAAMADQHLFMRPGGDAALLFGCSTPCLPKA
jgi:anaerobic selenocysteine-containing dehydrogenase